MLKELIKIANELDKRGLVKEADKLDRITKEASAAYCWMLLSNLFACKTLDPMPGKVVFTLEDTTGDWLMNKLSVSTDAEWMNENGYPENENLQGTWEDSGETDLFFEWPCVSTKDPYHQEAVTSGLLGVSGNVDKQHKEDVWNSSARITLRFSREDSGALDDDGNKIWNWNPNPVVHAAYPNPECSGEDWNEYWTELAEDE